MFLVDYYLKSNPTLVAPCLLEKGGESGIRQASLTHKPTRVTETTKMIYNSARWHSKLDHIHVQCLEMWRLMAHQQVSWLKKTPTLMSSAWTSEHKLNINRKNSTGRWTLGTFSKSTGLNQCPKMKCWKERGWQWYCWQSKQNDGLIIFFESTNWLPEFSSFQIYVCFFYLILQIFSGTKYTKISVLENNDITENVIKLANHTLQRNLTTLH